MRKTLFRIACGVLAVVSALPFSAHAQLASLTTYVSNELPLNHSKLIGPDNIQKAILAFPNTIASFTLGSPINTAGPISTTSYVTASTYYGDGSHLTGISPGSGSSPSAPQGVVQINSNSLFGGTPNFLVSTITPTVVSLTGTLSSSVVNTGAVSASTYAGDGSAVSVLSSGTSVALPLSYLMPQTNMVALTANACDGTTDSSDAVNGLAAARTVGLLTTPRCNLKLNSSILINANQLGLSLNGATLGMGDLTGTSPSAITISQTQVFVSATSWFNTPFENFQVFGPGMTSGTDGLLINTHGITVRNAQIDGFRDCLTFGNNSYILNFESVLFNHCGRYTINMPAGLSNYGENISFRGGGATNSLGGLYWDNANSDGYFTQFSFDSISNSVAYINNGRVSWNNVHVEILSGSAVTAPVITVGDHSSARLYWNGGEFLFDGTGPFAGGTSYSIYVGSNGQLDMEGVRIQGTAMLGGCLKGGPGRLRINHSSIGSVSGNNDCVSSYDSPENILADPGFEKPTMPLADLVYISKDATGHVVVSQTASFNVNISVSTTEHLSGAQSLAVCKTNGASTGAGVRFVVPVSANQNVLVGNMYMEKPGGGSAGTAFATSGFGRLTGFDSNLIPNITSLTTIGTTNIVMTSSPLAWTKVFSQPMNYSSRVPKWANVYTVTFNLDSIGSGCLYFDNITWNEAMRAQRTLMVADRQVRHPRLAYAPRHYATKEV